MSRRRRLKRNSLSLYERAWRLKIAPEWAKAPIAAISPIDVQEQLFAIRKSDAKIALSVFKGIVDFAMKFEAADTNKLRLKCEMPSKVKRRSARTYSLAEAGKTTAFLRGARNGSPTGAIAYP